MNSHSRHAFGCLARSLFPGTILLYTDTDQLIGDLVKGEADLRTHTVHFRSVILELSGALFTTTSSMALRAETEMQTVS